MSVASDNIHAIARATRSLLRGAETQVSVSPRTPNPVRRHTYDIDDDQAQIRAPLSEDGSFESSCLVRRAIIEMLEQLQRETAPEERYRQGVVTRAAIAVAKVLLTSKEAFDHLTGTNDLAESELARLSGVSKRHVVRAKAQLAAIGLLDWVRRSVRTGRAKLFGVPQHITATCLYFFTPEKLDARAKALYQQILWRLKTRRSMAARRTGKALLKTPLKVRDRGRRNIPALVNPFGWARVLKAEAAALAREARDYATREAEALAYTTALAQGLAPE